MPNIPNTPQAMRELADVVERFVHITPEQLDEVEAALRNYADALAQIEALKADVSVAMKHSGDWAHKCGQMEFERDEALETLQGVGEAQHAALKQCDKLRSELAAAKRDGERYQFIRKQETDIACCFQGVMPGFTVVLDHFLSGEDLDRSIDAAIEQGGRGNG